ncbi:DUF5412 domain-containing protein [Neobacillus sp. 19]|uniref:DUF5412 domain-containing protein n=1 Tax=Neobacillus sp. 19 TaxID=3394458 RepID=UPI003BF696EC
MGKSTNVIRKRGKFRKLLLTIFGSFFVTIAIISYGIYYFFYDMQHLPTGEYLTEETSPDGKYTVKAYRNNGSATVSYSIRGELIFNERNKKSKNIYWNYRENTAIISWIDKDTVEINGHQLDVPNEKFDYRQHLSN